MAGIAISPLLKINGDEAIAMACAAFCMPTSIIMVLRIAVLHPLMRDKIELQNMARSIRRVMVIPNTAKLSKIS